MKIYVSDSNIMIHIFGVDVPENKKILYVLTYIQISYGS
jgi:hypothetical protein